MARSIQWLEFLTQKERARREKSIRNRLLPFGEAQQTAELAVLRPLISTRSDDSDLLFQLIQAKSCLRPEEDEDSAELIESWQTSALTRRFSAREQAIFLALARLEAGLSSMDAFPTAEQVLREAEQTDSR